MKQIAYINDQWLPLADAKVSVLDRGFLFGDGIYEVIPVHNGKVVAINAHFARLQQGMEAIGMQTQGLKQQWMPIIDRLIAENEDQQYPYQGLYLQVTRGADTKRQHGFPSDVAYTKFGFMFEIPPPPKPEADKLTMLQVGLAEDLRWRRCHIKSTSLLGNVLHYQQGNEEGFAETILYNQQGHITEASACNVFMVKGKNVITAPLDHQLLPGITRGLVVKAIEACKDLKMEQRYFSVAELMQADEVWLTSSTKEIAAVSHIDNHVIADGKVGEVWPLAIRAFNEIKFDL